MRRTILPLGLAVIFLFCVALGSGFAMAPAPQMLLVILAAVATGYMALNIGANDVANNMGPAVGAKALTMVAALGIAAMFDLAGALLAGGDVVKTVAEDLLSTNAGLPPATTVRVMIAALVAAALWINGSTFVGTPVSTTHAIIGSIIGAAVGAAGLGAVNWPTIGVIAISWTLSPLLGGLFAAALLALIRRLITRQPDKVAAARLWVPLLVAAMSGIFAIYLVGKVLIHYWQPDAVQICLLGFTAACGGWLIAAPWVQRRAKTLSNRKKQVATLFRPPLIIAAALLCFAHGANDVANAVAPLYAVLVALQVGPTAGEIALPLWALATGGIGLSLGIALFGPRVIHTVGEQITRLNEIRAFCVAISAAITVLTASALGLPLSSTHVAIGAVFGVGFIREYLAIRNMNGAVPVSTRFVDATTLNDQPEQALERERRYERRYLVRRLKVARIGAAWLVTLPAAAMLGGLFYWMLGTLTG